MEERMSVRKTRSDKGQPRKPAGTQREAFCDWFAVQSREEQNGLMRDMALIQKYAAPVPATPFDMEAQ